MVSSADKYRRLIEIVTPHDTVGILIEADPDAMASAMALKRLLWRKAKKVSVYRCNTVKRADNLAFIKLLRVDQTHIRNLRRKQISKWATVDAQPDRYQEFLAHPFDIVIDHHPVSPETEAQLVDIREDYGANSTIMTEYLRAARIRPSPRLATALFCGIKTDTQAFTRASTDHDIIAFR
jgi:nanoRNase/pAp phosphatase (c-di-AMP/oligoRNAs hydrolase)